MKQMLVMGLLVFFGVMLLILVAGAVFLGVGVALGVVGLALRIAWIPFEILFAILRALLRL